MNRQQQQRAAARIVAAKRLELDGVDNTLKPHEIAPGWAVAADWDAALIESWAERKARQAAERARQMATA